MKHTGQPEVSTEDVTQESQAAEVRRARLRPKRSQELADAVQKASSKRQTERLLGMLRRRGALDVPKTCPRYHSKLGRQWGSGLRPAHQMYWKCQGYQCRKWFPITSVLIWTAEISTLPLSTIMQVTEMYFDGQHVVPRVRDLCRRLGCSSTSSSAVPRLIQGFREAEAYTPS